MNEIIIREFNYTLKKAKKLKEIDQLTFNDCKYNEQEIINISRHPQNKILLAEYNDTIVGFISLLHVQTLHYHGLWVDLIAVNPNFQNMGIGEHLLESAIKYGEILNVDIISGLVAKNNYSSTKVFQKKNFTQVNKEYHLFIHNK